MCSPSKHHHYLPSEPTICKPRAKRLTLKGLCLALGNPAQGRNSGCTSSKLFIAERSTWPRQRPEKRPASPHINLGRAIFGQLRPMPLGMARSRKNGLETHSSGNGGAATPPEAPKPSPGREAGMGPWHPACASNTKGIKKGGVL